VSSAALEHAQQKSVSGFGNPSGFLKGYTIANSVPWRRPKPALEARIIKHLAEGGRFDGLAFGTELLHSVPSAG